MPLQQRNEISFGKLSASLLAHPEGITIEQSCLHSTASELGSERYSGCDLSPLEVNGNFDIDFKSNLS